MRTSYIAIIAALSVAPGVHAEEVDAVELGTLTLEAESDQTLVQDGYVGSSGRQATRVDTAIQDVPQAISIVTQDQIEDQRPRTLLESLSYSSGVGVTNFGFDTRYDAIYLRGFSAYYNGLFRDGLRQVNGPSAWYRNEPFTFEGAAVLKGPSSALYGVSGAGGIVNVVSKRPKDERYRELQLTTGSENRKELAFDFSGPLDEEGRLSYRLTGISRNADTPLEGYSDDLNLIAPALTYKLTDQTTVTILGEYADAVVGSTAVYHNSSYGVASDFYVGDPEYNDFENTQWRLGYEIEHEVNNNLILRQKLRYSHVDADMRFSGVYPSGSGLSRYWGHYVEQSENLVVDTMAEARFDTGPWQHTMVAGVDVSRTSYDADYALGYVSALETDALTLPYYGGQEMDQVGIYLHDQMVNGPFSVFLSGRYDQVDLTTFDAAQVGSDTSHDGFSGRVGVSYMMNPNLSLFGNVSSSFVPTTGLIYTDPTDPLSSRAADPTRGLQKEVGVKYQLPGTDSLISLSVFDIQQEDGVVFQNVDPTVFGGLNQIQVPYDLRSRGLELEGQFNYDNGLRLIGSYTYLDMEIEAGTAGTVGKKLSATPEHAASLWAFYEPQQGALKGFGFGAGLRYVGESWGDDQNSFKNGDAFFADLALTYDFGQIGYDGLGLQVNVKNIFDETGQNCSGGFCYRQEGRTATATLNYRF